MGWDGMVIKNETWIEMEMGMEIILTLLERQGNLYKFRLPKLSTATMTFPLLERWSTKPSRSSSSSPSPPPYRDVLLAMAFTSTPQFLVQLAHSTTSLPPPVPPSLPAMKIVVAVNRYGEPKEGRWRWGWGWGWRWRWRSFYIL